MLFEHYGRLISTNLPVYLRKIVQVSVGSSETITFSEFSNALAVITELQLLLINGTAECYIKDKIRSIELLNAGQNRFLHRLWKYYYRNVLKSGICHDRQDAGRPGAAP